MVPKAAFVCVVLVAFAPDWTFASNTPNSTHCADGEECSQSPVLVQKKQIHKHTASAANTEEEVEEGNANRAGKGGKGGKIRSLSSGADGVASKSSLRGGNLDDCLQSVPHTTDDSPGVMEEHAELKVLHPGETNYDRAFWNVSVDPADAFGDKGCRESDLGGMKNWEIVEVVKPLKLYGAKFKDQYDDYWFADDLAINQSFIGYSNTGMLTCWNFTKWMECTVKPGITLIAGEGASRDTCKTMQGKFPCDYLPHKCDYETCSNMGTDECPIVQHQMPPAKILQYIVKPAAWKMECHVCDLYAPNLKESCTKSVPEPIDLPEPIEPSTGGAAVGGGRVMH